MVGYIRESDPPYVAKRHDTEVSLVESGKLDINLGSQDTPVSEV